MKKEAFLVVNDKNGNYAIVSSEDYLSEINKRLTDDIIVMSMADKVNWEAIIGFLSNPKGYHFKEINSDEDLEKFYE